MSNVTPLKPDAENVEQMVRLFGIYVRRFGKDADRRPEAARLMAASALRLCASMTSAAEAALLAAQVVAEAHQEERGRR